MIMLIWSYQEYEDYKIDSLLFLILLYSGMIIQINKA